MTDPALRYLALALLLLSALIGIIAASNPDALGIPPLAFRWLLVAQAFIGVVLGFLPRVQPTMAAALHRLRGKP